MPPNCLEQYNNLWSWCGGDVLILYSQINELKSFYHCGCYLIDTKVLSSSAIMFTRKGQSS